MTGAASGAWNATGGKVVHAAKEGGGAVGKAAADTGEFVWRNRGTIATVAAVGTCLVGAIAACGYAAAIAFTARASQRIEDQGFSNSLGANLADAGLTYLTFGLGGAFDFAAGDSRLLGHLGRLIPAGYDITSLYASLRERSGC